MQQIWGVPTATLWALIEPFQGFQATELDLPRLATLLAEVGEFRPRGPAEEDPSFKQIIPYVHVRSADRHLLLERLPTQGESRLHHLFSIGVGGHVEPEPGNTPLLVAGLSREIIEELEVDRVDSGALRLLGFLNDDRTPVGRVHFGIACQLTLPAPVVVREIDKMRGQWVAEAVLRDHHGQMETWSQILLDWLAPTP